MVWPVIGAIVGAGGTAYQNNQSKRMAREQMTFQRQMSNTAYQRAARDMKAAGLNRVLALGSPASSPGGAQAPIANIGSGMMAGAASAAQVANTVASTRYQKLQSDIVAPEAHRARLLLEAQKAAEKKGRSVVSTYASPVTQFFGEMIDTMKKEPANKSGDGVPEWVREYERAMRNPKIDTPSTAKEIRQGTVYQHLEAWAEDFHASKGRWPNEKEIRAEYERAKKHY